MKQPKKSNSRWQLLLGGAIAGLLFAAGLGLVPEINAEPRNGDKSEKTNVQELSSLQIAQGLSDAFAEVAERVNPAVVTIFTEAEVKRMRGLSGSPFEFFGDKRFERFFWQQGPRGEEPQKQQGLGSGVIIEADGIILTNHHVIKGADEIKVRLIDGQEYEATVKGSDPQTDLAVLSIDAKSLPYVTLGNSDQARVGEWVLAIGSPLNANLNHTVTNGIISAKGRNAVGISRYEDFIQTDAAINPGNSGGALVNLKGELIGINTAIATRTGGNMGIGFAIPANLIEKVKTDLLEKGKVERGWLGVYIQNVTPEIAEALELDQNGGVIVTQVQKDSPAEAAGLQAEDIILEVNDNKIDNTVELSTQIANTPPGSDVRLKVLRDENIEKVKVKLGELDSDDIASLENGGESALGLKFSDVSHDTRIKFDLTVESGAVVTAVNPGSIAARAGLQAGDVIVKFNRERIRSAEQLQQAIKDTPGGRKALFAVRRDNGSFFIAITMPEK